MVEYVYRVGAGTAHGFGLLDYVQKKEVTNRCTLNPQGKANMLIMWLKQTKVVKSKKNV